MALRAVAASLVALVCLWTGALAADVPWTLVQDIPVVTRWFDGVRLVDQPITAELYRPTGLDPSAKLPAVVIVNSSGGVSAQTEHHYGRLLARQGIAALVVDSFLPRGVRRTTDDQSRVWQSQSDADAAAGFRWLAAQDWADTARIAVLGMSRGGSAALATAFVSERRRLRIEDVRFAAHVAIATGGCRIQPREVSTTGSPIFFMLAELDDYTPIAHCLELVSRMQAAGATNVRLAVYPGVYHAYEVASGLHEETVEIWKRDGCSFLRSEEGALVDRATGAVLPPRGQRRLLLETCIERRPVTVGGDPRVKAQADADLLQFLRDVGIVEDREVRAAVPDCSPYPAGIVRRNCDRARAGWTGDIVALARYHRYRTADGSPNEPRALALFRLAAGRGHPAAMWELALMRRDGLGAPSDLTEAVRLALEAAEAGEPAGMNLAGVMAERGTGRLRDDATAVLWFRRAAELRHPYGLFNLGRMYRDGRGGLPVDKPEAVRLWRRSAAAGNPWGQVLLARALETGDGAEPDTGEARRLYQVAAAQDRDAGARLRAREGLARLGQTP